MGILSVFSSKSEADRRAEEVRTGARAPDRSERRKCWEARDAYFSCLDRNSIVNALKDDDKARKSCPEENTVFERDCAAAWVKYFKQWRVADIQKRERIAQLEAENAVKVEFTPSFAENTGGGKGTSKGDIQDMLAARRK